MTIRTPHIASGAALNRRHFLRKGAIALSLPMLDAMTPAFAASASTPPKRFVAACATLGFHTPLLYPAESGRDYTMTPYLEKLALDREDFSVISGLSHREQQGPNGHVSEMTWLTGATRPGMAGFRNSVSLDQLIAHKVGLATRFPYLALTTRSSSLSWTSNGVEIPAESSPSELFRAMFAEGSANEVDRELDKLRRGRSILDTVLGEARKLSKDLGHEDRQKLDEYLSSVRELESRLQQSEGWVHKPKPKVAAKEPSDISDQNDSIARQGLLGDMIILALRSDSTRTVTFRLSGHGANVPLPGVKGDWHGLSHHGKDPDKIKELRIIEEAEFAAFGQFLNGLKAIKEGDGSLLDHTAVLFGSNLGNASSHDWHNVPIVLAGGGYNHGSHIAFDPKDNPPLANLFVNLAQRMGVETDRFATSNGAGLDGLKV